MNVEHLSGYQARDVEVVDYRMYELAGTGLQFRGPSIDTGVGKYFTCIGAAQTFGRLCNEPYPALLGASLELPALNLGYGGAGPEFFARHQPILEYVNAGRFLVLQVMSGRSQSNSMFASGGLEYLVRRSDGVAVGASEAYSQLMAGSPALRRLGKPGKALARVLAAPKARQLVSETRHEWIESYRRLLDGVGVPTILLWFSRRSPAYRESMRNHQTLFGEFPQLVNQAMVDEVGKMCDAYVECVTSAGSPQLLISRFTGKPTTVDPSADRPDLSFGKLWTHNTYYPSPEMHTEAAAALLSTCRRFQV